MVLFKISPVICSIVSVSPKAQAPSSIDLQKYTGKWYVIGMIPTVFDVDWNQITETYTLKENGNIDIFTTYVLKNESERRTLRSKGFPVKEEKNILWKIQFLWPFKVDYLIEEIAEDYSYTVVGHPRKKFLYIMSRTEKLDPELFTSLVEKYGHEGYDTSKLKKPLQ